MNVQDQINAYFGSQPEPKRSEMQSLHELVLKISPGCKLWYTDGKNSEGKVITNPDSGYGSYTIKYKDGASKEYYRIGLSATKTGISVYVLGIEDKTYLPKTFGERLGKAKVTGYCISFKTLQEVDIHVLEEALRFGFAYHNEK